MTGRSKVLAPLATVAAVAAVALTASLVAGGRGGARAPRVLHLASAAGLAATADASTRNAAPMAGGGDYRLAGDLPQGTPPDARAWTLPAGPADGAAVGRLARALKAGTPHRAANGWTAGGLRVNGEAGRSWYWYQCGPETSVSSTGALPPAGGSVSSSGSTVPDGQVSCGVDVAGVPSSGSGTAGSASGSGSVSTGTVVAEPPPAPAQSPGSATTPRDKPAAPPKAEPLPPQKTPTKDAVRAAAAPVLDALGLADQARVTVFPGGGSVLVEPRVGGLDTSGWSTRVDVDAEGVLRSASGWMANPEKADSYPLISAKAAFDALPAMPRMMMACPVGPGGSCQQPPATEITGAHLGLTVAQLANGGQLLVPAWLFDVKGSDDPLAGVAVDPKYLGSSDGPTADPAQGKPTQVDPAPGKPTQVDPAPARSPLAFDAAFRAKAAQGVVVQYGDSSSCPHANVSYAVKEDATSVYVALEADSIPPDTACTEDYRSMKLEVALQAPLGDRKVIDASNGHEVKLS